MKRCVLLLLLALLLEGAVHPAWGEEFSGPVATFSFNGAAVSSAGQPVALERAVLGTDRCGRMDSALQLYPVDYALAKVDGFRMGVGEMEAFAISAWIYPRDIQGYRVIVEKFAADEHQRGFRLAVKDGRLRFWWSSTGKVEEPEEYDSVESDGLIPPDRWTHVAVSFRGGSVRLYINGQPDTRTSSRVHTVFMGAAPLGIGGNPATTGFLFDGLVDSVSLWNRSLEKDEVAAMQAGGCE
ncbi:LamG domain-containing protein [Megalodesulfovibrio paquesii]